MSDSAKPLTFTNPDGTTFTRLVQPQEEAAQIIHKPQVLKWASEGLGADVVGTLAQREKMFIDGGDNIGAAAGERQPYWADLLESMVVENNSVGMKFALIPPGDFPMGSPEDEAGSEGDEKPHRVRITQPFYLGVHEVTRGQFAAFVTDTRYKTECESDGKGGFGIDKNGEWSQEPEYTCRSCGFPQSDEHPVVNVSWNDAQKFVLWLNRKEGRQKRLPTKAEWEYSCRSGSTTMYSNGNNPENLSAVGNTDNVKDGHEFTVPVGPYKANNFGLLDMHGNVWEWCEDVYDREAYNGQSGITEDLIVKSGVYRVLRGGGWFLSPASVRSVFRRWSTGIEPCV